jgi:aminodeoxyfutalosine synthase
MPKEDGGYTRSLEEVFAEAEQARGMPTKEFHIVGGLHPKLRLSYYTDMIRGLKERHPDVHIKALTAVEIAHLARIEKATERDVLIAMKEAGLTSLPGGGAEVFSTAVRATIAERKLTGQEWLRVHRVAHEAGAFPATAPCCMATSRTMDDRIEHLGMLRELQDETGGFLTYIPLAYHPDNNELGEELGRTGSATTGYEDLRNIAIGRLYLDNIPHVKTHWPMVTPFLSQIALAYGCDDVEGTVVYERIYHEAGAHTAMHMHYDQLVEMIRGQAGARSSATACTSRCAKTSPSSRGTPTASSAPLLWCTRHEARPHPLDQLLPGLRGDRPWPRAVQRRPS